ncbi:unnamed protein product [Lactuca virosa]|uniref:Uncharacterized protein n=1 Tax=Lactuca virosa TaxID=75947 RepID=A0AAU9PPB4_9ASTR|nr:unnamed protein product [Lactuca virosa]
MKEGEVTNNVSRGFNGCGNGKKIKNYKEDLQGQNGNKAPENSHYAHSSRSVIIKVSNVSPSVLSSDFPTAPMISIVPAVIPFTESVFCPSDCLTAALVAPLLPTPVVVTFPM